jgi:hypothetical protein
MTKKARRGQIMEACDYPDKRIEYHGNAITYRRSGELLKEELREVLKELGVWSKAFETQHKRAWRGHIRDAVGLEYDGMGWERFDLYELTQIWREVRDES